MRVGFMRCGNFLLLLPLVFMLAFCEVLFSDNQSSGNSSSGENQSIWGFWNLTDNSTFQNNSSSAIWDFGNTTEYGNLTGNNSSTANWNIGNATQHGNLTGSNTSTENWNFGNGTNSSGNNSSAAGWNLGNTTESGNRTQNAMAVQTTQTQNKTANRTAPVPKKIYINSCQTLGEPNGQYALSSHLSAQGSGNCISIAGANVSLDCAGYTLSGSGRGTAIYSNQKDTTIRNCNIENFDTGVLLDGADGARLSSLRFSAQFGSTGILATGGADGGLFERIYTQGNVQAMLNENGNGNVLDCQGSEIWGGPLIRGSSQNIAVKNCIVREGEITFEAGSSGTAMNNRMSCSLDYCFGLYANQALVVFANNTVVLSIPSSGSRDFGIFLNQADGSLLDGNSITAIGGQGICPMSSTRGVRMANNIIKTS